MIIRALIAVLLLTSACALAPAPAHYYPESVFPDFGKPWGEDRIPAIPELTRHDQMMSLHALAMALTVQQGESRYLWANPETTNSGEVTILGIIPNGPYAGCLGLQRAVLIQGRDTYREYPAACRGGGNSNTWIINRKWVISSVDRRYYDGCIHRFMDARLNRGRVTSTETVCQIGYDWMVGGW